MKKIIVVIVTAALLLVGGIMYLGRAKKTQIAPAAVGFTPTVELEQTTDVKSELDKTVDDEGEMQLKDLEKDVSGL